MSKLSKIQDPLIYFLAGNRWTDRMARLSLPILLGAAKSGRLITYMDLAIRINELYGEPIPRSFRNYGHPPGKIGGAINRLEKVWKSQIPPLNAIVVNDKTKLPGHGAYSFIQRYIPQLKKVDPKILGEMAFSKIKEYPKWDAIADYFESHIDVLPSEIDPPIKLPPLVGQMSGEETQAHKNLKRWAKHNPEFFSEFGQFDQGKNEVLIRSGDRLDVYFENQTRVLAVEVKAANARPDEIFRGIFQCVKYRAVLRATEFASGRLETAQAVLLTQHRLNHEQKRLAERLNVTQLTAPQI